MLFYFKCEFLMSYGCVTVNILWLILTVPWVGLYCVIAVFPNHTHLHFGRTLSTGPKYPLDMLFYSPIPFRVWYSLSKGQHKTWLDCMVVDPDYPWKITIGYWFLRNSSTETSPEVIVQIGPNCFSRREVCNGIFWIRACVTPPSQ